MHVSIDMDGPKLLHAHPQNFIVHGLTYLEGAAVAIIKFDDTERPGFLDWMTTLELGLFYRNLTGQGFAEGVDDLTRRQVLSQLIAGMTARQVDATELNKQISAVEDKLHDGQPFRYVFGAKLPTTLETLFPLKGMPLTAAQLDEAAVAAPQQRSERAAPSAAAVAASAPQPAPLAKQRAHAGSVRPTIWATADRMWEAAGKPTDKTVVLALRKEMMAQLETDGIKKTSSSNELGNWMKDRVG